jgi:hypothetical protein
MWMPRPLAASISVIALILAALATRPGTWPASAQTPAPADLGTAGQGARSPRNANYSIDATLDAPRGLISGRETLTWRNITGAATSTLQFHLYWNAWRNTRSTWMREGILAGTAAGLTNRPEPDWSWIDVGNIRLLQQGPSPFVDLTSRKRYIAPDDGNTEDRTVLEVPLPSPVGPGETLTLELEWQARVPRTFARTGRIGDFFFIAQWFPKVGVLEADGWNTHQFHADTEFFSDYGVYDVRLRVPSNWVVGATGRQQERRDNADGTTTHRYIEEDVHDFAWTTSPDFIEREQRFEHRGLPPVDIRLLLQPEHEGQAERHFVAARAALRYFGEWFGPYPYGHLTIVDPAWQSDAGGMEYPTLFTAGTRWLAAAGEAQPERVTVHESGHQFWYGMVGSNEFEDAWLDEGLVQFAAARVLDEAVPPRYQTERFLKQFIPWTLRDIPLSRTDYDGADTYRRRATAEIQSTPSWRYFPAGGARITYNKTALWLHTLERMLGWPTLQRVMRTFFERYQFEHPKPADFMAVANEVSGQDLTWFFDRVYRSSSLFDYAVADLQSHRAAVRGYVDGAEGRTFSAGTEEAQWETTVVVQRRGDGTFPVDVQVTFENGERVRERWDGRDRWRAFRFVRPSRARSAEVDPDRVLLLDVDYTDNSRSLQPNGRAAATKWSLTWLISLQDLLMTYGFFV